MGERGNVTWRAWLLQTCSHRSVVVACGLPGLHHNFLFRQELDSRTGKILLHRLSAPNGIIISRADSSLRLHRDESSMQVGDFPSLIGRTMGV